MKRVWDHEISLQTMDRQMEVNENFLKGQTFVSHRPQELATRNQRSHVPYTCTSVMQGKPELHPDCACPHDIWPSALAISIHAS